ncbi:hypothetical protein [Nitrosomonas sp.]
MDALSLVAEFGERYSKQLSIQLDNLDAAEIYKWLLVVRVKPCWIVM